MEIDLFELMKETSFNKMITIKKLSEISEKSLKECKEILDPLYEKYNQEFMCDAAVPTLDTQAILEAILYELREINSTLDDIRNKI